MKTKTKVFIFLLCICTAIFLLCYPYVKQINEEPPLYGLVIDYHDDRLSYDIIKSNYSRLQEKGYNVNAEDETIIISKDDLVITLDLNKETDKNFQPKVSYYHNVNFIFDTVKYNYSEQGLTITVIYKTTIFSKEPVVLSQLKNL